MVKNQIKKVPIKNRPDFVGTFLFKLLVACPYRQAHFALPIVMKIQEQTLVISQKGEATTSESTISVCPRLGRTVFFN
jgi:hypothetical protein